MSLVKRIFAALVLPLLIAAALYSQEEGRYPLGAILDEEAYNALPRKATLATRAYEDLPETFSLKQYAPQPGDQADYGTCVAWASAYGARTISESVALNRMNIVETTRNAFSPVYVYRRIRPDDPGCLQGAQISWALDLMRESGAVKMLDAERSTDFHLVQVSSYNGSRKYPIADYVTLFSREEQGKPGLVTRLVKKSLVEGKPVIIGMNTPDSFWEARGIWRPRENPGVYYGGHAMCVVGYDDKKDGGAFEVLNSWGRKWGNAGFIWIPYQVFIDFVMESYELVENLAAYTDTVEFAGFATLEILDGSRRVTAPLAAASPGFYQSAEVLGKGTQFSFTVGSSKSAYVYAFAASRSTDGDTDADAGDFYSPVLLFPQGGLSPLLNYSDSVITLPGNNKTLMLDSEAGVEYLVVLYAKQTLNIRAIMRGFENAQGGIEERLAQAVGKNLLTGVSYSEKDAAFSAETDNRRAITALVLAIDHR
ncbi:MAG: C1 family peptidase [Treponema sp.]|jgi:C1A family cysteine protease|nr:C1 family peptidase [Treponema sp.]